MAIAHGYYLHGAIAGGDGHTNVGLANCAIGAINAAVEHIPMLLFSGRTPTTERDLFRAWTVPIGWGQEIRDQTALVREAVKWDYELRFPEQVAEVVDRAGAFTNSAPRGPVYVSLPREVLCQAAPSDGLDQPPLMQPTRAHTSADQIEQAAQILASARSPVIFAQHGAGSAEAFAALSELTQDWSIPVCQYWALGLAIPTDRPMAAGPDPAPLLEQADAILVLDALAPWSPDNHRPDAACRIIQMGPDPLSTRIPVRNFQSDLLIACDTTDGILALKRAIDAHRPADVADRARRVVDVNARDRMQVLDRAGTGGEGAMNKDWVSLCLSWAIQGRDASVLPELGCPMAPMTLDHHRAWYQETHAGGLGWSFPAALGM
ncbi:thiamine pyrophosphate-binding protein [Paracoccus sediminilitoris]|uniref:thiamine pyrophosphate-binding protein n=1 Tax=Paracoccus sediminilitoris TaxID=2202419 RepID=UPI001F403FD4|nr:thiamine pyrophosphate-binding protein [Paracoccus sediminilitoris]